MCIDFGSCIPYLPYLLRESEACPLESYTVLQYFATELEDGYIRYGQMDVALSRSRHARTWLDSADALRKRPSIIGK